MATALPGRSFPLGAQVYRYGPQRGVNFSVYSRNAAGIDLLLFDGPESERPSRVISLDPRTNRTFNYWHVLVPGLHSGQVYAYRARGKHAPGARPAF